MPARWPLCWPSLWRSATAGSSSTAWPPSQVWAMVDGAVIISLNARTMRAANVMASFIILPMSVVLQVEAALILLGRSEFLWAFAGLMILLATLLLRMGLQGFSREALLAREAGLRNPLKRAGAALRASFAGRPGFF